MISDHNASQVALVGSTVIRRQWDVIRAYRYRLGCGLVCGIYSRHSGKLCSLPRGYTLTTWLPGTARARVIIWEYTAEQVFKHPLLGVGVESTAILNKLQKTIAAPEQPRRLCLSAGVRKPRTTTSFCRPGSNLARSVQVSGHRRGVAVALIFAYRLHRSDLLPAHLQASRWWPPFRGACGKCGS